MEITKHCIFCLNITQKVTFYSRSQDPNVILASKTFNAFFKLMEQSYLALLNCIVT